jgi:hypothetical protein
MAGTPTLRAIADVHGHPERLACAAAGAETLVLLGDLVDRGPDSPGALRLALSLVESGRARLLRSNHDDKLYRWLRGRPVQVGKNLGATIAALNSAPDAGDLKNRFLQVYEAASLALRLGRYVFAHGAVHPDRFSGDGFLDDDAFGEDRMALFGEVTGETDADGRPVRFYSWVDRLPEGVTAIVGHDQRDGDQVVVQAGARGGRAVFLDSGCGKGGPLSFIDLPHERIGQIR